MNFLMHFKVFETHEFLVTHFTFVFVSFGLLSTMDTHMFNEIWPETNDTSTNLTFVRFTTQTMFLIILQGFQNHITDGTFHLIHVAGTMNIEMKFGIETFIAIVAFVK